MHMPLPEDPSIGDFRPVTAPKPSRSVPSDRTRKRAMRKTAYISSIVLGIVLIVGGVGTWIMVSNTLANQNITVSDDADCLAGDEVDGPFSAYCQAKVIDAHTLDQTGGLTYAELDREDPLRQVAMNSAFLQSSLFTSVVAFGTAGMAILMGVVFTLIGLGMKDVGEKTGEI
jgi:hypothetical protein